MEDPPPNQTKSKGGFRTMPFIIVNESLERVASFGLLPNMIFYLTEDYGMSMAGGTAALYLWSAATNFMPIFGAFLADSLVGRFLTIGFGSVFTLLGMVVFWLTTMIPQFKPPPCNPLAGDCQSPTAAQYAILVLSFALMSIGAGGVRPCSQAFGADQVARGEPSKNKRVLETFFNWYYACTCLSVLFAITVIVYIQEHAGWRVGYGVPALLMLASVLVFFAGSPLYVKMKPERNLFASFARVIASAYRNRHVQENGQYHHQKGSKAIAPSTNLRFLNKACLVREVETEPRPTTVEEVEEFKSLIRVLPIWSSGIMLSITTSQPSFLVVQAKAMDRHLTSKFEVPAGSFGMFLIIVIVLWVPIYDRVIIPLASKVKGRPVRISVKVRMGVGLAFTTLATVVSALVESARRSRAHLESPKTISAFWLIPQYGLNGLAEAFNAIGQTEFYYSEFPKSMSSVATALFGLGIGVANLLASAILRIVDRATKEGGGGSWVNGDVNKAHYDYYYWVLAGLSFVNLGYYLVCSWAYGPCRGKERAQVSDQKDGPNYVA